MSKIINLDKLNLKDGLILSTIYIMLMQNTLLTSKVIKRDLKIFISIHFYPGVNFTIVLRMRFS